MICGSHDDYSYSDYFDRMYVVMLMMIVMMIMILAMVHDDL